ncbi:MULTISPECIES: hypothetical protein [Cyanophyceae]|uniref:hypothetical protein n=1 Tax=Cyanophyceae TaxID=3028117 RepID=UPI001686A575|nr:MULTISPECIES: hypothetical protein [Cyanophyceae]MBD1915745.1 hypothetical protein [Phormidium sp. FACHB-77]MBD2030068.1 hypothetical protein [Phormidium sp. FACHB-322]MBD2052180.1 hypothetical protein [Leptolyngbya sp. FACHB-60]
MTQALALSTTQEQQVFSDKRVHRKATYILREAQIPTVLKAEVEAFKTYCHYELRLRPETYNDRTSHLLRLLGWCHNIEGESVDGLSFTRMIPFVPLTSRDSKLSVTQRHMEHHRLDEAGAEATKAVAELLNRYFDFYANSLSTQALITQSLILAAKFVYRDEIKRLSLTEDEDLNRIPVIRRLRQILEDRQAALNTAPPVIDHESRSIPWETTIQVLNRLREKLDTALVKYEQSRRKTGPKQGQPTRSRDEVARYLQTFLIVGFFIILPPDRNRTVRQLEIGRTLRSGLIQEGIFTPVERLSSTLQPRWYIYRGPEDYKTGCRYGESWTEVPDMPMGNGMGFYHYLNLWITDFRQLFSPQHNVLFVTTKSIRGSTVGVPQTANALVQRIRNAFKAQAGVPVVPQALRKMFTTYLKSSGAEEPVLEAAAVAMKHSRRMQEQVYDQQPHPEKIQPILDFNMQLFELIFVAEEHPLPLTEEGMIEFSRLTGEQRQLLLEGLKREANRRRRVAA